MWAVMRPVSGLRVARQPIIMRDAGPKIRYPIGLVVGVITALVGIGYVIVGLRAGFEAQQAGVLIIASGAIQTIAWLPTDPASTSRMSFRSSFSTSRLGAGFSGLGIGTLLFSHSSVWSVSVGVAVVTLGASIACLPEVARRRKT
jgi:hypothetical protein